MCGIIGIYKHDGQASVELYEGLLMLQHRGQDSAGGWPAARWCRVWCGWAVQVHTRGATVYH
jgi:hypothetical protein